MSREAHVRFCESVAVRFRRATRPPSESWFKTLKSELLQGRKAFASRLAAPGEIFEYVEVFYNRQRLHSSLSNLTPVEFEQTLEGGVQISPRPRTLVRGPPRNWFPESPQPGRLSTESGKVQELGEGFFDRLNSHRLCRYYTQRLGSLGYQVDLTLAPAVA